MGLMPKKVLVSIFVFFVFVSRSLGAGVDFCSGCRACLLGDAETGEVIYGKNVNHAYPVGSIVKTMLELIVAEKVEKGELSLSEPVRTSAYASRMGGSQVYLKQGETYPLEKMLEAVAVASANDAAVAIAEHISGSVEGFLDLMRIEAKKLGLKDSIFYTVHGLPDARGREDLMSPRDIFTVARKLVNYSFILRLSSIKKDTFRHGRFILYNTNKLLGRFRGLDGLKTGHTNRAGYCFVATAKRKGVRLIAVVLGCRTERQRFKEASRLLNYGFNLARRVFLVKKGDVVKKLHLPWGDPEFLPVVASKDFYTYEFYGMKIPVERRVDLIPDISPPIKKGQVLGSLSFYRKGKLIGSIDLVAGKDCAKIGFIKYIIRKISGS